MVIDIAIGVALLIALFVGYQRGVIQPLLVELFFVVAILLIVRDRHAYTEAMSKYLHANTIFAVFIALIIAVVAGYIGGVAGAAIHRMPVVRGVDGFLGVFFHVGLTLLGAYFLLSALVALDKAFQVTYRTATLNAAQVQQMRQAITSNPLAASIVDTRDLDNLAKQALTPNSGGARIQTVSQLDQLATLFQDFVEPQLASSRLAKPVLAAGHRIPVIGKVGPADLPTPAPKATPTPTPKPSPTK